MESDQIMIEKMNETKMEKILKTILIIYVAKSSQKILKQENYKKHVIQTSTIPFNQVFPV